MVSDSAPQPTPWRRRLVYGLTVVLVAAATAAAMWLWQNISERRHEARESTFQVVPLSDETVDPAVWGQNYPRQYDSYRRTVDVAPTRHGGSDAFQKLDVDPRWRTIFAGYAFAVDYREERGHAYMLRDRDVTERVQQFSQPGACLHCHASILPAYRFVGRRAGIGADRPAEQVAAGFERVCAMPYAEARHLQDDAGHPLIEHSVACVDCHDPTSMALRIARPGFLNGIRALAASEAPLPHLPSIERWRREGRAEEYDVNAEASRQEMRSLVCAQCHVEYYFHGAGKLLTYPWRLGVRVEQIEACYDELAHTDWTHAASGAPLLKAQHPEFEVWSQGIHARSGVACADCHMPYERQGAVKVSDHHVRSPLLDVSRACQTCHRYDEGEILSRAEAIQDRTRKQLDRAENAVVDLIAALERSAAAGLPAEALEAARQLHRQAQWRLDFVAAENSLGFHAPQEAARILAESIDLARQGELILFRTETTPP
jgi:nitrite reductase (cytochrome c-552)